MISKLYDLRFELFFFSQLAILFGSLVMPAVLFENLLSTVLFLGNLSAGIILISKKKRLMWFCFGLLMLSGVLFVFSLSQGTDTKLTNFLRMGTFFMFYVVVSLEIVVQVWRADQVGKNVILGVISGYLSLGLIGFFICLSIEMGEQGSFQGIFMNDANPQVLTERLMYFSYITLLTIGYGDIVPVTPLAQKAVVLIGLMGQFYLVIITATIVGKYINQSS